jgi:type IV pilus assembly protein PilB
MSQTLREELINILIKSQILSQEQVERALKVQREKGGRLGNILVSLGLVKEKDLMIALSRSLNIAPLNLSKLKFDPHVAKVIPEPVARNYHLLAFSLIGDTLSVVMSDPLNVFALDDIKALTHLKIKVALSTETEIRQFLDIYYGHSASSMIKEMIADREAQLELVRNQEEELDTATMMKMIEDAPVVKITNLLLNEAINSRASDILIEPLEKAIQVRLRVDGVLHEIKPPPRAMHDAIITRIKVMSKLDISEHRLPQDGRFKVQLPEKEIDFRVSILPSSYGEKAALRVLDRSSLLLDLTKLGFEEFSLKALEEAAKKPHGMILVCGPTGSGKTTTLYSVLKYVDSIEKNIVTVEDPIEYLLDGINQVNINPEIGLTFAGTLRSILRQDPNIIMVGEIRDFDTVDIAIKAALTGHLVLSTLHTTDAAGSIVRLCNMGVEPFLLTASVLLVSAQRLLRVLCPVCKEPYEASEALIKELKIKSSEKLVYYRPRGCENCNKTGYRGRSALVEALVISPKVKNLIIEKAAEAKIKETARREGTITLRECGLMKAKAGITSIEEVLRVTAPDEELK